MPKKGPIIMLLAGGTLAGLIVTSNSLPGALPASSTASAAGRSDLSKEVSLKIAEASSSSSLAPLSSIPDLAPMGSTISGGLLPEVWRPPTTEGSPAQITTTTVAAKPGAPSTTPSVAPLAPAAPGTAPKAAAAPTTSTVPGRPFAVPVPSGTTATTAAPAPAPSSPAAAPAAGTTPT